MKEKLTKNLGIKLLSIPLAAIIWIVIINIDDPISTKVISNVPVEILNESYITQSGQVYDIVEGNTVSVTVRAKRSIRDKIKASDLRVTADLADITQFKRVEIVAECTKYPSDTVEVIPKPKMLTVTLEDIATKTLPIQITTTGVADSGYYVDSVKASPNMIEIKGAESTIDRISDVRVSIDVSGHQENFSENAHVPKVYDEKGREVDASRITFSHSDIKVKATILPTKMVPIQINTTEEPADGYKVSQVEFGPEQIELAGESDVLSRLYMLTIPISVKDAKKDIETDIDLKEYLPKDTKLVSDTTNIAVRITIEQVATKKITLTEDSIDVKNLPDNYSVKISKPYPKVSIMSNGESDLKDITAEKLNAYIDVMELSTGTHEVEVQFVPTEEYQISEVTTLTIIITEENENGEPVDEDAPIEPSSEETITD